MSGSIHLKKLRKRLDWLWANRTHAVGGPEDDLLKLSRFRYVPRAFSREFPAWGVYDRLEGRFISDAELVAIDMERLQTATHLQ